MTAVATPSIQSLPRLGWSSGNNSQGGLTSMSAEDVQRMFMPRKVPQRSNSSSSISSTSTLNSSTSISVDNLPPAQDYKGVEGDTKLRQQLEEKGWVPAKKPGSIWPSKAEAIPALARPQSVSLPSSGQLASAPPSLRQPSGILPSQNMVLSMPQQNGVRPTGQILSDPPAVLALIPMNGTFERKQITVPQFPEILRIGRQTNAKTVPTPINGYFDSKVLSRQHAEVWADRNGKIWIRDVKSSNGTFVNGMRLSPENRESEPQELREHDMLELGIDIVSEDQKSIVHHKVSAKVEHAGIHHAAASVLDLNLGDIDPGSGGGLMGLPFPQHMQMRGRGSSQGSVASSGRMNGPQSVHGGNMNVIGAQRHSQHWHAPGAISIEQLVKTLASELKQAKQQANDLHRTEDFFSQLLNTQPGQELPKVPAGILSSEPQTQTNGVPSPGKPDPMSPFSQPPAPPPSQPLPEKPTMVRSQTFDHHSSHALGRDMTKARASLPSSPTKLPEQNSSQILSLVEALTAAKREIDSQGSRVKQLEEMLKQERRARESAEEQAKHLLAKSRSLEYQHGAVEEEAFDPPSDDSASETHSDSDAVTINGDTVSQEHTATLRDLQQDTKNVDTNTNTTRLQERLELMMREMDEMKIQMQKYKARAETAEEERSTLAEMVQRIRDTRDAKSTAVIVSETHTPKPSSGIEIATQTDGFLVATANGNVSKSPPEQHLFGEANGKLSPANEKQLAELQSAMVSAFRQAGSSEGSILAQSAPYASMLGVVLIGVGIMTYLNGWQKGER